MAYTTIVTSKGTVTIAAPLRRALGIKAGQTLTIHLNQDSQLVLDSGTDMKQFQAKRARITKSVPSHLKGLAGDSLQQASAAAWVAGHHNS